jgi:hypothetical protein
MFNSSSKVDWELLHQQKIMLLAIRNRQRDGSAEFRALSGIIHLLDALQDDAAAEGLWTFPGEEQNQGDKR